MMPARFPDHSSLEPAPVWAHFATLCRIPRRSKEEGQLRDYLIRWARERGLDSSVDGAGNLLIRKPAGPGREQKPGVVLQSHLDMVCQKNSGSSHDFSRDPIRPVLRDGWLLAEETTLGADNGMGVALALAVLEDGGLTHGPIEALFTVDEEAGMGGARRLEAGWLQGRLMLNLDTEAWGELYLGCAGGMDVVASRPGTAEPVPEGFVVWRVALTGLRGGHSGVDIHEERGNAIKLLVRVLRDLESRHPLRLADLQGGTARNALPREAFATLALPAGCDPVPVLEAWQDRLRKELRGVDEGLTLAATPAEARRVLSASEQAVWLATLHAAPHGVKRRSLSVPGVVETSDNLGVVDLGPEGGAATFMVRSLLDDASDSLANEIVSLFALSGTRAEKLGPYPAWTPDPSSALLGLCQSVYRREFGGEARVMVIHAGLECGLIGAKYPGLDMVSLGPTIRSPHAPGEAVEVASVGRTWHLLKAVLEEVSS
ncbi:MAG: aminoacyl-histidine dipeptidase [Rhodocyclaceae bacterium]|nr:aminoacyl-histidine dipeptidase [Rhodocyclaceae bacterium]